MKLNVVAKACFFGAGVMCLGANAWATGTCTVTAVTFATPTYDNAAINPSGTVSLRCRRSVNSDGNITVQLTAGPGLNLSGGVRRVLNTATYMAYSLSTQAGTNNPAVANWGDGSSVSGSSATVVTFVLAGTTNVTVTIPFTLSMGVSLNPRASSTYTDTVSVGGTCATGAGTACTLTARNWAVSVNTTSNCRFSTTPGPVTFSYTSFQAAQSTANTSYGVTCTNALVYRMNLTTSSGSLLGLPYSLILGTAAGSGADISSTTTYNRTGTGAAQTYYVNGTIASGLGGTCALGAGCSGTNAHTLNIDY